MYADSLNHMFNDLTPDEIFPYAPPQGIEALRDLWQEKILKENPDLTKDVISRPIVTNALTHGLSLVADLFVNPDDTILLPTHNWVTINSYLILDIMQTFKHTLFSMMRVILQQIHLLKPYKTTIKIR